jgi:hypothetical protein
LSNMNDFLAQAKAMFGNSNSEIDDNDFLE